MKKIVMVHIPKTAGGSIERWFGSNVDTANFRLVSSHRFIEGLAKENPTFEYSFAVVRNTYDRIISGYLFLKHKQELKLRKQSKKKTTDRNLEVYDHALKMLKIYDKGLEYFVEYAQENPTIISFPQIRWIQGVDHIFRMENLVEDFKKIQKDVNCFVPLDKTNHVLQYNKQEYMTKKFISVVEKYYTDEIQFFNYKPSVIYGNND